ncbi:MAG: polyprenyl synthetase family protein [Bacteroidaceae bacterium]|nr:polyprenyl synthetase family protein [Bacteroidaceae bacterium]
MTTLLDKDLTACKEQLLQALQHVDNPLLCQVLDMVKARTGKMMRPQMVLLSAKLFGPVTPKIQSVAVAYEALHTASLIHDDVVDESDERRGHESINHAQTNRVAILSGDYILGEALRLIASVKNPQIVLLMSKAAKALAGGELLQLHTIQSDDLSEATYMRVITDKTAALFAACAASGATMAGASQTDIDTLYQFALLVGQCFQIKDDILDYEGGDIGKPKGNDLKEGKITLPLIYALRGHEQEMLPLIQKIKQGKVSPDEIQHLIGFAKQHGGIDYAISKMNQIATEARRLLARYEDSPVKAALMDYVDYVIQRNY